MYKCSIVSLIVLSVCLCTMFISLIIIFINNCTKTFIDTTTAVWIIVISFIVSIVNTMLCYLNSKLNWNNRDAGVDSSDTQIKIEKDIP